MDATPPSSRRTRDLILVGCSCMAGLLALKYRAEGAGALLAWLATGLFWLAVLDSTRGQSGRTRIIAVVASGVLIALAAIALGVMLLTMRPPVQRVETPAPLAPASATPPSSTAPR